jgi:hypothetical protein
MTTPTKTLTERAKALRQTIEAPSEKEVARAELARIEGEIQARKEAEAKEEAARRQIGIGRAFGSLCSEIEQDEQRCRSAGVAYANARSTLNQRYRKLMRLKSESHALTHRFGVPGPDLAPITVPVLRGLDVQFPPMLEHAHVRQHVEKDEYGRSRRDYGEIAGTEGYRIIEQAGLVAWPELSPEQRARAAAKSKLQETDQEVAEEMQRAVADIESMPPVPGGVVRRG